MSPHRDLPKFSTWAGGEQPQLDSVTISKHVKQMVDVSVCVRAHACVCVRMRVCACACVCVCVLSVDVGCLQSI